MMNAKYLDSHGFPVTLQGDGGDSCADYFTILALSDESDALAPLYFNEAHSCPIRHPDAAKWYGQPDRESRDQLIPILCYGAIRGLKTDFIRKVFKSHLKRGLLLTWNTRGNGQMDMPKKLPDLTGPEIWGLWLRIFKPIGYKLLLPFCDLETLVNSILWKSRPKANQITRNHMLVSIAQRQSPSVISDISYNLNDFKDLNDRWEQSNIATGEYPTSPLFKKEFGI